MVKSDGGSSYSETDKVKLKRSITKTKSTIKPKKGVKKDKAKVNSKGHEPKTNSLKKQGFMPGQKFPRPPKLDGDRIFYTTWLEQEPGNATAQKYLLEYGLFSPTTAKRLAKK